MGKYQSPKLKDVSSNLTAPAKLLECLFGFHDLKWVYINTHEIMGFKEVYHCSQVCKRCNKTIFVGPVAMCQWCPHYENAADDERECRCSLWSYY